MCIRDRDRELYIGLDSAVTIGHPVTISVGFLMIPVFMVFAAILPGNTTLPLGEVPFAAFYVCFATIVHRGNRKRTIISSLIFIPIVLWISSWAAPLFTELASNAGLSYVPVSYTHRDVYKRQKYHSVCMQEGEVCIIS